MLDLTGTAGRFRMGGRELIVVMRDGDGDQQRERAEAHEPSDEALAYGRRSHGVSATVRLPSHLVKRWYCLHVLDAAD